MRIVKLFFRIINTLIIFLGLGCIYFAYSIPTTPTNNHKRTDAVVVLTGGLHRIEAGFQILSENKSRKLFISGVYNNTKLHELLIFSDHDIYKLLLKKDLVKLGKKAHTTKGNAEETYEWIKKNNIKSIRLVTSNYHMPRSIFEFKKLLPNTEIIPNPVFSKNFQKKYWWRHYTTAKLILKEYVKFLYIAAEYYYLKFKHAFFKNNNF